MFFFLSKVLAFFISPLTWIIGLSLVAFFTKRRLARKRLALTAIILLIFFGNQYISNRVMLWWEYDPLPMKEVSNYDVGIVFSGVTRGSKTPRDRVYFKQGADRITHTLQLFNEGKLKHILVSGGQGFQQIDKISAAARLKTFLVMAGVPDSVIIVENMAVNTYENARNTKTILDRDFPNQKYLLITSAFHMKRSLLCMKKQGIEMDAFPAGYLTSRPTLNFDDILIPKSEAIHRWEVLIKEFLGIATYKIMGYI